MKPNNKPYILGLTGGIASGKSNVAGYLRGFGCPVIDADEISRNITAKDGVALPYIRQAFGNSVFYDNGELNRSALSRVVFVDCDKLEKLNEITHPIIFEEMKKQLDELSDYPIVTLEVPLLFETGMDKICDEVWTVYTSFENQMARLMKRNKLTEEQARARIMCQISNEEKLARSDHTIDSSFEYENTFRQTEELWNDLLRRLKLDS
jgi:dephospho-CoA kinase